MKQIGKSRYGDYRINFNYFCKDSQFKRSSDTSVICVSLFQNQHQQMIKILIVLCKHPTVIYHFNTLRIISIIYHIYIECEYISWHI